MPTCNHNMVSRKHIIHAQHICSIATYRHNMPDMHAQWIVQAQLHIPFAHTKCNYVAIATEHAISMCMSPRHASSTHRRHSTKISPTRGFPSFERAFGEDFEVLRAEWYVDHGCTHAQVWQFPRAVCRSRLGKDMPIYIYWSCSCIAWWSAWPDPTRGHCTCT